MFSQLTEMWKAIDSRSQKAFVLDDYNTLDDVRTKRI